MTSRNKFQVIRFFGTGCLVVEDNEFAAVSHSNLAHSSTGMNWILGHADGKTDLATGALVHTAV
jgi:hypothetical protein